MSTGPLSAKVGIAVSDTHISGTARRLGNLFRTLSTQSPSIYHFIVSEELYEWLNAAGYHLDDWPNVHRVRPLKITSHLDSRRWESRSIRVEDAMRFLTLMNFRRQVARIVRQESIGILQVALDPVYVFGLFPVPGVVQIASLVSHLHYHYDRGNFFGRLLQLGLPSYDVIDCISPYIYERVLENGFSPDKVFCAPNSFVDVNRYKPEKKNVNEIVFAVRVHKFKNPELFIDAISHIIEECPRAVFHLRGAGPMMERLDYRLGTLGLKDHVHSGFVWDTSRILNKSSINVHLEAEDNYPNQSVLEGMAAGNAIIATDVGLTRRLVDETNGILVPLSDPGALAEAVIWMLEHPTQTLKMGKRSREKVLRGQRLETYLNYIQSVYLRASSFLRHRNS